MDNNKITIVFGASGQLGQCLKKAADEDGIKYIDFLAEQDANILNTSNLENIFEKYKPAFVINCAAYTQVDKAEEDIENARNVNKNGAKNLADQCAAYNAVLIHVSTDFVFKGNIPSPLAEIEKTEPINIYGLTKLEGELAIADTLNRYYILRTSWLYSEFGNNFTKTMLRLGAERSELKIIADQVGTPTYAIDLARCIIEIIRQDNGAYGIYHYSNEGVASWYDFAKAIFDLSGTQVTTLPIRTSEYPTKAIRPAFSVMDKSKIKEVFKIKIPYWRDSLANCLKELASINN
jgi:dTDP-4-dehydrorhamnose reductase